MIKFIIKVLKETHLIDAFYKNEIILLKKYLYKHGWRNKKEIRKILINIANFLSRDTLEKFCEYYNIKEYNSIEELEDYVIDEVDIIGIYYNSENECIILYY